jgi:hypothetical protein
LKIKSRVATQYNNHANNIKHLLGGRLLILGPSKRRREKKRDL